MHISDIPTQVVGRVFRNPTGNRWENAVCGKVNYFKKENLARMGIIHENILGR
jgi:hypothetical protein